MSGSPPAPELFARLTGIGLRPIHVYGATELYGPYMTCERQESWAELPVREQARLLGRQGVHYLIADPPQPERLRRHSNNVRIEIQQHHRVAFHSGLKTDMLARGREPP